MARSGVKAQSGHRRLKGVAQRRIAAKSRRQLQWFDGRVGWVHFLLRERYVAENRHEIRLQLDRGKNGGRQRREDGATERQRYGIDFRVAENRRLSAGKFVHPIKQVREKSQGGGFRGNRHGLSACVSALVVIQLDGAGSPGIRIVSENQRQSSGLRHDRKREAPRRPRTGDDRHADRAALRAHGQQIQGGRGLVAVERGVAEGERLLAAAEH